MRINLLIHGFDIFGQPAIPPGLPPITPRFPQSD